MRPPVRWRRLRVLIENLPVNSRTVGSPWGYTEHLLADLIDLQAAAHSNGKAKPYQRPEIKAPPVKTREEIREWHKRVTGR